MELGMYIHIPFCIKKCFYCDFISYPLQGNNRYTEKDVENYLSLMLKEAAMYRHIHPADGQRIKTLYIGGGTPTCLTGGQLFVLLDSLQKMFCIEQDAEITVEANPGTIDREKLQQLKSAGYNRLSLGVQSFDAQELNCLGRIYSPQEVYTAFDLARQAGFNNINIDLMYGLPGQNIDEWRKNLQTAVAMKPEHLSLYQLSIEKGTHFDDLCKQRFLIEVEQEIARKMFEETIDYLKENGFCHYEISNFARAGRESRHNMMYWHNLEYIGLGAGASGYLRGLRYSNENNLSIYEKSVQIDRKPIRDKDPIDQELEMSEHMFLGLRIIEGVDKRVFRHRFTVDIRVVFGAVIEDLKNRGLLLETDTHVMLSKKGVFLANSVFIEFLPDK